MTLKKCIPLLAGLSLAVVSVLFANTLKRNEDLQRHDALEVAAERIGQRISTQISALYAVRGLFVSSEHVTRDEFRNFAREIGIFGRARGVQGLGFAIANKRDAGTGIAPLLEENYNLKRDAWPASGHEIGFPIILLEPDDKRNRAALGYDMYTDATRRQAMDRAWSENVDVSTRPVTLVQEIDKQKQVGFLIYLPIYENPEALSQADGVKSPLRGFVYAAFRAGDLLQTVLNEKPAVKVGVRAYSDAIDKGSLLFANTDRIADASIHEIEVAGRRWIFELEDRSGLGFGHLSPWKIVLLLGLLLSAASALFVQNQIQRAETAELVSQAARDRANEKDVLLKEMTHRLKNVITRIVSMARMSSKSATDIDGFLKSLTGRLQAMAAAQELLANSDGQQTTIRHLVNREMELILGLENEKFSISGPNIYINESQSQALGLVMHELATNSTKYGALSNDGTIDLGLDLLSNGESVAELRWKETGLLGTADFSRQGFGSKLLTMMVEGQLKGKIDRHAAPGELHISISFPVTQAERRAA